MNTGLCWTIEATGSDCTRWQLRSLERPSGTTATRRDIETGRPMNLMRIIHVYVTRRTDSRTGYAITTTTTPARKLPVTFSITTCGNHCPLFFQSVYFTLYTIQERVIWVYRVDRQCLDYTLNTNEKVLVTVISVSEQRPVCWWHAVFISECIMQELR